MPLSQPIYKSNFINIVEVPKGELEKQWFTNLTEFQDTSYATVWLPNL